MGRLTRDRTAEPLSRDQIIRCERGQGNIHFPCHQLTTSRIGNLTRLIHTFALRDDHTLRVYTTIRITTGNTVSYERVTNNLYVKLLLNVSRVFAKGKFLGRFPRTGNFVEIVKFPG